VIDVASYQNKLPPCAEIIYVLKEKEGTRIQKIKLFLLLLRSLKICSRLVWKFPSALPEPNSENKIGPRVATPKKGVKEEAKEEDKEEGESPRKKRKLEGGKEERIDTPKKGGEVEGGRRDLLNDVSFFSSFPSPLSPLPSPLPSPLSPLPSPFYSFPYPSPPSSLSPLDSPSSPSCYPFLNLFLDLDRSLGLRSRKMDSHKHIFGNFYLDFTRGVGPSGSSEKEIRKNSSEHSENSENSENSESRKKWKSSKPVCDSF
jgi:hypothetical protein